VRVSTRQSVRTPVIIVSHRLLCSRFGSTADGAVHTLVSFLRPAVSWKCGLVMSRKDSLLSRVFVVLISCMCVCVGGVMLRLLALLVALDWLCRRIICCTSMSLLRHVTIAGTVIFPGTNCEDVASAGRPALATYVGGSWCAVF